MIEAPSGYVVVIDGGGTPGTDEREGRDPGSRILVPFLRSHGISTVDLLVATHPDEDHVQGLNAVVNRLKVQSALESGLPTPPNTAATRLQETLRVQRVPQYMAQRGQQLDLGSGARLEVLHPRRPFLQSGDREENNNGIALRLVYGRLRVLFTADLEQEAEYDLLQSGQPVEAQVLKVGHHGSRTSSSSAFLKAVNPRIAIISCGRDNHFGHPHKETLERLKGVEIYRTDRQGAITLESDGNAMTLVPFLSPERPIN